jgi:hypothetical protein
MTDAKESKMLGDIPTKEPGARESQNMAKTAVLADTNFAISYLLARVIEDHPYEDYELPDSLAEFEFTLKGIMRYEMLQDDDMRPYRRLLGSSFTRKKTREKLTWRSRISITAFDGIDTVRNFFNQDPLSSWPESSSLSIPADAVAEDWYILFQVQDVDLPNNNRLADFLVDYLNQSELLTLVAHQDLLSLPTGGNK